MSKPNLLPKGGMRMRTNVQPKGGSGFRTGFLLISVVCILIPLLVLGVWCFTSRWPYPDLLPETFSLRGVIEVFVKNKDFSKVMGTSFLLSGLTALGTVIISTMAARAFVFYEFAGKQLFQFLTILPIIVPGTVFGMGVHIFFIKAHLNNTLIGVLIVHLICALPYGMKIMTEITELFGTRLEEQARVLGASAWSSFRSVTLPAIVPGIASTAGMAFIISFGQYFLTLVIGGGRVKTFSVVMVPFIQNGDKIISANYSMAFILSAFLVFLIFDRIAKKYTSDGSKAWA